MGTKKVKLAARRTGPRNEKLIKVPSEVHQRIKINSARAGLSMGKYVDVRTKE